MSKDLDIIRQLEKQLNKKIPQLKVIDFVHPENRYVLDERGNVTGLSLWATKISDISCLKDLSDLTELYLGGNQISDISPLEGMTNLTELCLYSNKISDISTLKNLTNLTKMDLKNNRISDISYLKGLTNLTTMDLSSNQISEIAPLKNLTNLITLDLGYNQINDISALKEMTNLTDLCLYSNKIRDISALLGLTSLTKLDLGYNQINDISHLKELTNLTGLGLYKNQINDISSLKGLTNLNMLDLRENQISDISPLKNLTNLTELYLGSNQIIDISAMVGLTNLTNLDLSYNKIKKLPLEITDFPWEIEWTNIWVEKGINLCRNPVEIPPFEIVEQGKKAIREYFKSLAKEEKRLLNEVKALLVGDGGAGKTSLVKRIIYDKFDPDEKQTHGVYRDDWQIETDSKKITIHFWDFGGQGIMQAAHQLFFSIRSLYILVMNARQEPDPEDWFKRIESFGGDSPIMVVINKIDENPYNLNEKELQRKYPSIKGFYHVSCREKTGLEDLKKALIKQIAQVEMIQTELPLSWFNVKKRLEELKENYITLDQYKNICQEEKVTESNARKTLIDYLHILGVALHYEDFDLLDKQVLNPEWITKAIYKIINSKKLKEEQGILSKSSLSYILNEEVLPDLAGDGEKYSHPEEQYIIDVMKKFELCFELDRHDKADYMLVPDLLKADEPDYKFPQTDTLSFYFEYDFLPSSILPSFMVKRQKDVDQQLCWRTGLVMRNKNFDARALVQIDKNKRRINIRVAGVQKRDYFSAIRDNLLDINSSFQKLDFKEWVPLPDEKDFAVEYEDLLGYERTGRDTIFFGKLRKEYSVSKLLDGIETPEEREIRKDKSTGGIKIEHIDIHGDHTTFADEIGKIETNEM